MTDLENRVSALLKLAPGEPPMTLDPDVFSSPIRPRRTWVPLLAAAMIVILVAVITVLASARSTHHPAPTGGLPTPEGYLRPGEVDPHFAQTTALVRDLLAAAPVLPHAKRVATPPVRVLRSAPNYPPPKGQVTEVAFWTAPGTVLQAVHNFDAQRNPKLTGLGATFLGSGSVTNIFSLTDTPASQSIQLYFTVAPAAHGVGVRVDVRAAPVPSRMIDTLIPDVSSVSVVYQQRTTGTRSTPPPTARTIDGSSARELADGINELPEVAPARAFCVGGKFASSSVTVDLHTSIGNFILSGSTDDCLSILTLTTPTHGHTQLLAGQFDTRIRHTLGLPAH